MTREEFEKWTETPEGKAIVFPVIDKRVSEAIETYRNNHPGPEAVEDRLAALEEAAAAKDKKIREMELDVYAFKKSKDAGIDQAVLKGYAFATETEIDEKITQIAELVKTTRERELNEQMQRIPKPGSGISSTLIDLKNMSPARMQNLDMTGALNEIIQNALGGKR